MSQARNVRPWLALAIGCSALTAAGGQTASPERGTPLSSMVALTHNEDRSIPQAVRELTDAYARGTLGPAIVFPVPNGSADAVRAISSLSGDVVVSWLDPLTADESLAAPRYGANNDFIAYLGDGWNANWRAGRVGASPAFRGDGRHGWMWTNHEYISNGLPSTTSAPTGQHLTLAKFLRDIGLLSIDVTAAVWGTPDVDAYVNQDKRQLGGSWFRVGFDPSRRDWSVDRSANNLRYDATSSTLLSVTGHATYRADHRDDGSALPAGVVAGTLANCSGGVTPWGTIITAEENVQDYYGDLETAWTSAQKFVPGAGFDAGDVIHPTFAASTSAEFGRTSNVNQRHDRDVYGYLAELDPGVAPGTYYTSIADGGTGVGHRKIGAFGRARWENATFVVDPDFNLLVDQPIVLYSGDDRRSGRIFKFVSKQPYRRGMSRAQVRALLDEGSIYVAHFAGLDNATGLLLASTKQVPTATNPGVGQWLRLSVDSTDRAPNGPALGKPRQTVGQALRDVNWNGMGGFRSDDDVKLVLFSAANKIGVMELNRPEDLEWNPRDPSGKPRLYVAFTNNGQKVALDQNGVLFPPAQHATLSPTRPDRDGVIYAISEKGSPASSTTFKYLQIWRGKTGRGLYDAADPDNILIDSTGGVWFGTDGNFGRAGTSDAVYYLDLDPRHRAGQPGIVHPTYLEALRIAAGPSDSEATGPAFNSTQSTLFFNVQHPGEEFVTSPSTWPPR